MDIKKAPSNVELPSTKKLIKSTFLALGIATVILITTVLPAEYGIDPTGVGEMLGLKTMGEIKVSLAEEAVAIEAKEKISNSELEVNSSLATESIQTQTKIQTDEMIISLNPNEGKELKLYMKKGDQVNYTWFTDGAAINFDAHTDSGEYHNYNKGLEESDKGILEAVYNGRHGWWWKNRTSGIVTITLQVDGKFLDFREDS